jgi:hypothetical protein
MPCDKIVARHIATIDEGKHHYDSESKMYHYEIQKITPFVDVKILKVKEKLC